MREQEGWLAANGVKVVLKPFKVAHLEHAIEQALALPDVTPSGDMVEGGDATASGKPSEPSDTGGAGSKPG